MVSVPAWQPVVDVLLLMRADPKVVNACQPELRNLDTGQNQDKTGLKTRPGHVAQTGLVMKHVQLQILQARNDEVFQAIQIT